jgi:nucleoside-diphosphate-sugar epimerase
MVIAVTGANGFIGQHVVRRFQTAGHDVRPIVRQDFELGRLKQCVTGADVVVHAAGATRAPSVAALRESNVVLATCVAEAARAASVGRIVFVSSLAAAGPAASLGNPVTGNTPPAPVEAYGQSKLDGESLLMNASGVPAVIVRPAAVYGPGDRDFLALFRLARRGLAVHPGNRDHWLSIIHVSDLAEGILRCASAPEAIGRIYCLANDEPVRWADLFRVAAGCAGRTVRLDLEIPAPVVRAGAVLGDIAARVTRRAGLLTSRKVALSAPRYWVCSTEQATRELDFTARTELQQGFCDTYRWYLDHGWL